MAEEEAVRARARQWFSAWRSNQEWPADAWGIAPRQAEPPTEGRTTPDHGTTAAQGFQGAFGRSPGAGQRLTSGGVVCGGKSRKASMTLVDAMSLDHLIRPPQGDNGPKTLPRGARAVLSIPDLRSALVDKLSQSIAKSTNRTYAVAWDDWIVFCRVREENTLLVEGSGPQGREDEERLLLFCTHLASTLSRAAGTVKNKLMGIRHVHVVNGMGDPLVGKPRIWLLLRSLKKLHKVLRRYPVTVVMLLDIYDRLDLEDFDQLVLWTALCVGFLFLLRGGEYLCHDGADWDWPKIVRGADIKFWFQGRHTLGGFGAEEVSLAIRSAKADIFNLSLIHISEPTRPERIS